MKLLDMVSDAQRFVERREANLLDEHAQLLVSGRLGDAHALQAAQSEELASLMALAEEIALAVAPVVMSQDALARILRLAGRAWTDASLERVVASVRLPNRNTMLGAALVGTAAVSLGRFALQYHRRRQAHLVTPN